MVAKVPSSGGYFEGNIGGGFKMTTSCILFAIFVFVFGYLWFHLLPLQQIATLAGAAWIALFPSYWLSLFIWRKVFVSRVSGHDKAVLITGCSTGFGHGLAKRLAREGFLVFAGFRNATGDGVGELKSFSNIKILQLDVTVHEQVDSAFECVKKEIGNRVLWCVVSNAGIGSSGPLEFLPFEKVARVFDVNVFGALRVVKKFLPMLTESRGRVVAVGSLLGHFTLPMTGPYSMSKHALLSMMEAFRRDIPNIGVDFIVVEHGAYRTPMFNKCSTQLNHLAAEFKEQSPEDIATYHHKEIDESMKATVNCLELVLRDDVEEAVDVLETAVRETYPKTCYTTPFGMDSACTMFFTHAPSDIAEHVISLGQKIFPLFRK